MKHDKKLFVSSLIFLFIVFFTLSMLNGRGSAAPSLPPAQPQPAWQPIAGSLQSPPNIVFKSSSTTSGIPFTVIDSDPSKDGVILSTANMMARDSDGRLYVAYTLKTQQAVPWYNFIRWSDDDGFTWSNAVRTEGFPDSSTRPSLGVDSDGKLYESYSFNVSQHFTRSDDRGATWTWPPVTLDQYGYGTTSLALDTNKKVHVAYWRRRSTYYGPYDLHYTASANGGQDWSLPIQLTAYSGDGEQAYFPEITIGNNGWLYIGYDYYNSQTNAYRYWFIYNDGSTWSEPVLLSGMDTNALRGDLVVDSNDIVHLFYSEQDSTSGRYWIRRRTFDPVNRTLSEPETLSDSTENVLNISAGSYPTEIVVAYDVFTGTLGVNAYQEGVYARKSSDGFTGRLKVSTHAYASEPNLRSSKTFMFQSEKEDITWLEPNDLTGGVDLVYGSLTGRTPTTQALMANVLGPKVVNPGQLAPYVIYYQNTTETTAQSAVLVVNIPPQMAFKSCSNGCVFHQGQNAAIWKLGDISPGQQGGVAVWLNIPWGTPAATVQMTAWIDAANSEQPNFNVADYQNFNPLELQNRRRLSSAEVNALLSAHSDLKTLYDQAISQGFFYSGYAIQMQYNQSSGGYLLFLVQRSPWEFIILTKIDGILLALHQTENTTSLYDTTGSMTINNNDQSVIGSGDWAKTENQVLRNSPFPEYGPHPERTVNPLQLNSLLVEYGPQPEKPDDKYFFAPSIASCISKCELIHYGGAGIGLAADLNPITMVGKAVYKVGRTIYDTARGNYENLVEDVIEVFPTGMIWTNLYESTMCADRCKIDPYSYYCGRDAGQIGFQQCIGDTKYYRKCAVGNLWMPYTFSEKCPEGQRCLADECVPDAQCKPKKKTSLLTLSPQTTLIAIEAGPGSPCATCACSDCNEEDTDIVPAHDPNAKSVQPQGDILPGELLTYTIQFENTGAGAAYGVFILDTLDENLDDDTLQLSQGSLYSDTTRLASWYIGTVAPGAGGSVTMTVRTLPGLASGERVINQAEVHFPSADEITPTDLIVSVVNTIAAQPQALEITGTLPLSITLMGREATSQPLTYTVQTGPIYGSLTGAPSELVYQAMPGFNGLDEFTFTANHESAHSRPARVTIRVHPDPNDKNPPIVLGTFPAAGASDVIASPQAFSQDPPRYLPFLWVNFSKPMERASLISALTVISPTGIITGTAEYDEVGRQLQVSLSQPLLDETNYIGKLSGEVKDTTGNALGNDYTWSFTTAPNVRLQVTPPGGGSELTTPVMSAGQQFTATIDLANLGVGDLILGQISLAGAAAGDFSILPGSDCSGYTLLQGVSCGLQVVFSPQGIGRREAMLMIPSNDEHTPQVVIYLHGRTPIIYFPLISHGR